METNFLTAVFSNDELRQKYKNYRVPAAKILVGSPEKDLAAAYHAQIENIRISMNLKDAASVSFTVVDIYDIENHCFRSGIRDALCLGNILKAKIGYESELETLFCGFIYESSVQFGEIPAMQITAVDVRRLMCDNYRKNYEWQAATYSKLFEQIMSRYENLGLTLTVDKTTVELKAPVLQNGNDLKMVAWLCKVANRRFLVCGNRACFTEKSEDSPITTLHFGQDLLSFSQRYGYTDTEITVRGNQRQGTKQSTETRTFKSARKSVLTGATARIINLPDITSAEELSARADREKEALKEEKQSAGGSCIGIPVLVPGRYLTIDGLDNTVNGDYYITSTEHSFGTDGYTTDFTLGGKREKK